jgi:hypothetical protein
MAKNDRATDKLNQSIAIISSGVTASQNFIDDLPASGNKRALQIANEETKRAIVDAYKHLRTIRIAIATI